MNPEISLDSHPELFDRIMAKTEQRGPCLIWTGSINSRYPAITSYSAGPVTLMVRRLLYAHFVSQDVAWSSVSCTCGNDLCINPDHLILKGSKRGRNRGSTIPEMQGELHYRSKLTSEQVREVLSVRGQMTAKEVASIFGVSSGTIWSIWAGNSWRHLRGTEESPSQAAG